MSSPPHRTLRVLLIAEACNPQWTSVPLVGYNFARALSERPDLDLTLVTQVRNKSALEVDPIATQARICFVDNEFIARPLHRLSTRLRGGTSLSWTTNTALAWPAYMVFERQVFRRFSSQFKSREFDLIHRVTPLSPTMGSPLASLVDVPMIIGPLNGGLSWPKEYPELWRQEREWLVPLRDLYKRLPYYRSTYRRLCGVISGSRHTAMEIPAYFTGRRFYHPENGLDPERFPLAVTWPEPEHRFRFVMVGRLVPYKGTDLILDAMQGSPALRRCDLHIIGDGPQRTPLEMLAKRFGLESNVTFVGWVDQHTLARELGQAQAFVFPSLREFGGGVVLEAMASGLPSIVLDYGGPGELTTPQCSIQLPMSPREQLVPRLREAMEALASDPNRCRSLGQAACERVRQQFTWPAKAARIVEIYREMVRM